MNHRHLLPDEIDQLLDGEVGFGVAPLQAHLRECAQCQAAYEDGRVIVDALERLPRLAPDGDFTSRVMAQVQVYEPWHVAARDTAVAWVRPLAPRSRPMRVVMGGAALSVAAVLSVASIWLLGHLDGVLFFADMVRTNVVRVLETGGVALVQAMLGGSAAQEAGQRTTVLLLASISLYVVVIAIAIIAIRAAAVSRRRRA